MRKNSSIQCKKCRKTTARFLINCGCLLCKDCHNLCIFKMLASGVSQKCEICLSKFSKLETIDLDKFESFNQGNLLCLVRTLHPYMKKIKNLDFELKKLEEEKKILIEFSGNIFSSLGKTFQDLIKEERIAQNIWHDKNYLIKKIMDQFRIKETKDLDSEVKEGEGSKRKGKFERRSMIRGWKQRIPKSGKKSLKESIKTERLTSDVKKSSEKERRIPSKEMFFSSFNLDQEILEKKKFLKSQHIESNEKENEVIESLKCMSPKLKQPDVQFEKIGKLENSQTQSRSEEDESFYTLTEKEITFGNETPQKKKSQSPAQPQAFNRFQDRKRNVFEKENDNFFSNFSFEVKHKRSHTSPALFFEEIQENPNIQKRVPLHRAFFDN